MDRKTDNQIHFKARVFTSTSDDGVFHILPQTDLTKTNINLLKLFICPVVHYDSVCLQTSSLYLTMPLISSKTSGSVFLHLHCLHTVCALCRCAPCLYLYLLCLYLYVPCYTCMSPVYVRIYPVCCCMYPVMLVCPLSVPIYGLSIPAFTLLYMLFLCLYPFPSCLYLYVPCYTCMSSVCNRIQSVCARIYPVCCCIYPCMYSVCTHPVCSLSIYTTTDCIYPLYLYVFVYTRMQPVGTCIYPACCCVYPLCPLSVPVYNLSNLVSALLYLLVFCLYLYPVIPVCHLSLPVPVCALMHLVRQPLCADGKFWMSHKFCCFVTLRVPLTLHVYSDWRE